MPSDALSSLLSINSLARYKGISLEEPNTGEPDTEEPSKEISLEEPDTGEPDTEEPDTIQEPPTQSVPEIPFLRFVNINHRNELIR